ncbi:MAG: MFS transporter [Actinobacteria bacterium]|nr:MAG: MFS transporter [Actinomycetota bacterium]
MSTLPGRLPANFWRQFAATSISNIGDGMEHAAAPLLALSLTQDPRLIAGVSFATALPWLVLTLPAGVYIDRFNRKHLMITVNVIRTVLYSIIAFSAWHGSLTIWSFMLILLAVGSCEVIFDMSAQAFLPAIVPPELLEKANGRLYTAEVIANSFVGLPLGAWAFVAAVGIPFGANAASFALAAVLVSTIQLPPKDLPTARLQRQSFRADLGEGITWLWANKLIRTLAIMLGITNMATMFGDAIFVKYAADELGVTGRGYGFLLSLMAIGSIVGGFVGDRIAQRLGAPVAMIASFGVFSSVGLIYYFMPHIWSVAIAVSVMGLAGTTWNIVTVSLRQRIIPPELFGRVNSVYRLIGTGSISLGALIGGQIAYSQGLRATDLASGVVGCIALAIGWANLYRLATDYMPPEVTHAPTASK